MTAKDVNRCERHIAKEERSRAMQVAVWYDGVEVKELLDGEEVGCGEGLIIDALAQHTASAERCRGGEAVMVVMLIDVCVHRAKLWVTHRPHTHTHTHTHTQYITLHTHTGFKILGGGEEITTKKCDKRLRFLRKTEKASLFLIFKFFGNNDSK